MNYCPKCHKKLVVPDFCVECGTDLKGYYGGSVNGVDYSSLENEAKKQLEEKEREERKKNEFVINNGVLQECNGDGGVVRIPNGVDSIGERAFCGKRNVTEVIIPEGVKTICRDVWINLC